MNTRILAVWIGLVVATIVSWHLGSDHGLEASAAGVGVLFVGVVKLRYVGLYFMEIRDAPRPLRFIFEGWCLVVFTVLFGMYLLS